MAHDRGEKKTAGAFDIRSIIGALLGVYGIVLIIVFAVGGNSAHGNNHDNLWTGVVMLVAGLIFLAWARLRPVVVEDAPAGDAPGAPREDKTPPAGR